MRIVLLTLLILIAGCSKKIEVINHDYVLLADTYEKSEIEIKRDLQIIVKKEFLLNEKYLPRDLFTVKYSEKQRWMKFLELISKFDTTKTLNIQNFYLYYDLTETGITIDKEMYYDVEICNSSTIYTDQECDGDSVMINLFNPDNDSKDDILEEEY
jgi:hypothetical protein